MSHFEYISVAASLILALGVTRLVGGLTYVVQGDHRYWVHGLWCLQAVLNQAMTWWTFWNYRAVEDWTLAAFLLVLLYPVLTYVGACILVPAEASRSTDWRAHFFDARVGLFALMIVQQVTTAVSLITINHVPVLSAPIYVLGGFGILYSIGLFSSDPRLHAGIVVSNALFILVLLKELMSFVLMLKMCVLLILRIFLIFYN